MTPSLPPSRTRLPALLARERWATRLRAAQRMRLRTYRQRGLVWRLAVPVVFMLAGILFVTSAVSSGGTDLRAGRYGDLASVVQQQKEKADALREEANELSAEVDSLTAALGSADGSQAQQQVEELQLPAGLRAVEGPGLTIELDDAPDEIIARSDKPGELIVHQQDIQAVANALWAGGAEAMTIQGQRVISTTGIKCVGNNVVLHGIPYSPPYVITAVGDPGQMMASINDSVYVDVYLQFVERSQLGWDVLPHTSVRLPAYTGSLDLDHARPAATADTGSNDSDL